MKLTDKLKVIRKRSFSAHHILIGAARVAIEDAEEKRPGWVYSQLTAIALCGLAIEAICNAVGDRVIVDWSDFESTSPNAKVRLLCEHLKVKYDKAQKPWSNVQWLLKLRNRIAHAKPQRVKVEQIWSRDQYERKRQDMPLSDLERDLSLGNAKRALHTVEQVLLLLTDAVPVEDRLGLYSDAWEGSASAIYVD